MSKIFATKLGLTLALIGASGFCAARENRQQVDHVSPSQSSAAENRPIQVRKETELIRPGLSIGPLKLGDSQKRALELFPLEDGGHQWPYVNCGTEFLWVDSESPGVGTVAIHFKDGAVFQIDSGTKRYHTAEGITPYISSPEVVRGKYKGLRAYVLSSYSTGATGDQPLIYWVDVDKGIAFAFAYYPEERNRYLYKIIVFKPNSDICGDDGSTNSPDKRGLAPYSLELPNAMAHSQTQVPSVSSP